jgi:flagellar secretion chaperone FliS
MNLSYRQHALASANPIELVIALYDGAIRFLDQASTAAQKNDVQGRRQSVKRVLDIYLHLQSRLRYDVNDKVAASFSQFYTEMFRHTLRVSAANSREGFEQVIARLSQVKEAWRTVAHNPEVLRILERGRV